MGSLTIQEVLQDSLGKALNVKENAMREAGTETGMNIFVNRTPEELERKRQQKGAGRGANPGGKGGKGRGKGLSGLGLPPTKEEIQRAINEMDAGRAPGGDLFMAEYLKFGGPVLKTEIAKLVHSIWQSASTANEGEEVRHWPKAWSNGLFPHSGSGKGTAMIRTHRER